MEQLKLIDFVFKNHNSNEFTSKSPLSIQQKYRKQTRIKSQGQETIKPETITRTKFWRNTTEEFANLVIPLRNQIKEPLKSKQNKQSRARSAVTKLSFPNKLLNANKMRHSLQVQKVKDIEVDFDFRRFQIKKNQRNQYPAYTKYWKSDFNYRRRAIHTGTKIKNQNNGNLRQTKSFTKVRCQSSVSYNKYNDKIKYSPGKSSQSTKGLMISIANPQNNQSVKQYRMMLITKNRMKKIIDKPLNFQQVLQQFTPSNNLKKFPSKGLRTVKKKLKYHRTCQPDQRNLVIGTKIL